MSHIIAASPDANKPMFTDLRALASACRRIKSLELVIPAGAEIRARRQGDNIVTVLVRDGVEIAPEMSYRTYEGKTPGAAAIVRVIAGNERTHEVGIVPDPARPGCYNALLDPYAGGRGLLEHTGKQSEDILEALGTLLMHYAISVDEFVANELGHGYVARQLPDGSWVADITVPNVRVSPEAMVAY